VCFSFLFVRQVEGVKIQLSNVGNANLKDRWLKIRVDDDSF